jgi:small nuclear ribonucleoprotein (snRNP)-like protein
MTDIKQEILTTEKSDFQVEQARNQINNWLNKPMRVSIIDGRVLVGVLLCTDRDRNLILGNCNEYIGSPSEQEEFRVLGLALIPGQHIQSIYIDESTSSSHSNPSHTSITKSNDHTFDDDKSDG